MVIKGSPRPMKSITEEQVKQLLPISQAIDVVQQAFKDYATGVITTGERGTLELNNAYDDACLFLPAYHRNKNFFSLKYATSFPSCAKKNLPTVQSAIWLFSAETGQVVAMIQANALTAIKTGAASAVATRHLCNAKARILTIIGAGGQAKTQLAGICQVCDVVEIRIVDLNSDRSANLKRWAVERVNSAIGIVTSKAAEEAVRDADIIITCTTSSKPVLHGHWLKPGAHINAIGSFTPKMQEIDEQTIIRANKIVTDSKKETLRCAGDLIVPMEKGLISRKTDILELGDMLINKSGGRRSDSEITLYESVGFAPLDLAVAIATYEQSLSISNE